MNLIIISLLCFRLTRLITHDKITENQRDWLLCKWPNDEFNYRSQGADPDSDKEQVGFRVGVAQTKPLVLRDPTLFGRLISCDLCLSVWLAPVAWLVQRELPEVALIGAAAGIVYLLAEYVNGVVDA